MLTRRTVRPFTDKQIELVTTFADQAVIAIENVRLFDEVQARTRELSEALEQQTATSEVLQVISSSPGELEPVFEAMLANATRLCEAKFGILQSLRRRGLPQRRAYMASPEALHARLHESDPSPSRERPCRDRANPAGRANRRHHDAADPIANAIRRLSRSPISAALGPSCWCRCSRTTS